MGLVVGNIVNNGILVFNCGDVMMYVGIISGMGNLV